MIHLLHINIIIQDLMKAKDGGIDTYNQEQLEKIDILKIF